MSEPRNLEIACAHLGSQLAGKNIDEKALNAALTVLEEQGPYAMFLYLKARHREAAEIIEKEALDFLKSIFKLDNPEDALDAVKELAKDLDKLLFARDLLRTALSYARYHLKAKGGESK